MSESPIPWECNYKTYLPTAQNGILLRYDGPAGGGLPLLPRLRVHQGAGLAGRPQGPRPLQPQARGPSVCTMGLADPRIHHFPDPVPDPPSILE